MRSIEVRPSVEIDLTGFRMTELRNAADPRGDPVATPAPPALIDLLACPRCGESIAASADLSCTPCHLDFPRVGGIPWLFAEPGASLAQWRARADFALTSLRHDHDAAAAAQRHARRGDPAQERLQILTHAYDAHRHALEDLLAPLLAKRDPVAIETHLALKTRLPTSQGLTSYYANLFRDWCWGDAENSASLSLVLAAMGDAGRRRLVLGAGAGRLAYDLHRSAPNSATVALDFNPLLLLAARRIVAGEVLRLYEFPIAPKRVADTAAARNLHAHNAASHTLEFVLGDALRPPFRANSFDRVLTPWVVDVIDEDLPNFARRINGLLQARGTWIIFGSLAFEHPDPSRRYSREEVDAHIRAAGFEIVHGTDAEIPYMNAPSSRHARRETVVAIAARKVRDIAPPSQHESLPAWLIEGDAPVPLLGSFQTQVMTTRIYAFLMSLIDGKRSLEDMAREMENQKLMPSAEAKASLRSFLTKMYEESKAPPAR